MREGNFTRDHGHTLHYYDHGPQDAPRVVFWMHGTPNIGPPPAPLFADANRLGMRWIGYDRPGYGGSTARAGRDVASAADDVACIADGLGIHRFAVVGHSGGGPHALACAALLAQRVLAAVSIAGLAPYAAPGLDWFSGMQASSQASLRAALGGRAASGAHQLAHPEFDPAMFIAADRAALSGPWAWFDSVVGPAIAAGPEGMIDDDAAYVTPWGFDCGQIGQPVLVLQGGLDRIVPASHGAWLAHHCPAAQLWRQPTDGHISVLRHAADALEWLAHQV